jgi:hypothetical protein
MHLRFNGMTESTNQMAENGFGMAENVHEVTE